MAIITIKDKEQIYKTGEENMYLDIGASRAKHLYWRIFY